MEDHIVTWILYTANGNEQHYMNERVELIMNLSKFTKVQLVDKSFLKNMLKLFQAKKLQLERLVTS